MRRVVDLAREWADDIKDAGFLAQTAMAGRPKAVALYHAVRALPPASDAVGGERWRHKKRGTTYTVIGQAVVQAAPMVSLSEGHVVTVYRADSSGTLWVRPFAEFRDGRFERIPAPPSTPEDGA